jgi:hypothetical protein
MDDKGIGNEDPAVVLQYKVLPENLLCLSEETHENQLSV